MNRFSWRMIATSVVLVGATLMVPLAYAEPPTSIVTNADVRYHKDPFTLSILSTSASASGTVDGLEYAFDYVPAVATATIPFEATTSVTATILVAQNFPTYVFYRAFSKTKPNSFEFEPWHAVLVLMDRIRPTVSGTYAGQPDDSESATISLVAVDTLPGSDVARITSWIADGPRESTDTTSGAEVTAPYARGETQTVSFKAFDHAGNESETETIDVKVLDRRKPTIKTNLASPASYQNTATVTLTATDTASGIAEIAWCLNDGRVSTATAGSVDVRASAPGTNTVDFSALDRAGNRSETETVSFWVARPTSGKFTTALTTAVWGSPVTWTGSFVASGDGTTTPASGASVALQKSVGSNWESVATTTTGADGTFSLRIRATVTGLKYRVLLSASGAQGGYGSGATGAVVLTLKSDMSAIKVGSAKIDGSTLRVGRRYYVGGSVTPVHKVGSTRVTTLYFERKAGGSWKPIAKQLCSNVSVSGSWSAYRMSINPNSAAKGSWRIRAVHAGDSSHTKTTTPYYYFTIK